MRSRKITSLFMLFIATCQTVMPITTRPAEKKQRNSLQFIKSKAVVVGAAAGVLLAGFAYMILNRKKEALGLQVIPAAAQNESGLQVPGVSVEKKQTGVWNSEGLKRQATETIPTIEARNILITLGRNPEEIKGDLERFSENEKFSPTAQIFAEIAGDDIPAGLQATLIGEQWSKLKGAVELDYKDEDGVDTRKFICDAIVVEAFLCLDDRQMKGYKKPNLLNTLLLEAATHNAYESMKMLLPHHKINYKKTNALVLAVREGHENIVELLLDKGADVNGCAELSDLYFDKVTPLMRAIRSRNRAIFRRLLEHPDINVNREVYDHTPLTWAIEEDNTEAIDTLLAHPRIDINKCPGKGQTPLIAAVTLSDEALVKKLLKIKGIDVNALDNMATTAFDFAKKGTPIYQLLQERGAKTGSQLLKQINQRVIRRGLEGAE